MMLVASAYILAVAWLPVGYFFFGQWRLRHNPISLAIVGMVLFNVYCLASPFFKVSQTRVLMVLSILNALVLVNFYASMYWSRRHFKDSRKRRRR